MRTGLSRRSELRFAYRFKRRRSSRTLRDRLQPQDAMSRHRGADLACRRWTLGRISLLSPPPHPLSVAISLWAAGSLEPAFAPARPVRLAVKLAKRTLRSQDDLRDRPGAALARLRYSLGGDPQSNYPPPGTVRGPGQGAALGRRNGGQYSRAARQGSTPVSKPPAYPLRAEPAYCKLQ